MMQFLRVKNWREFQHYSGRKPSWIKLHRDLLDNFDYHCLPVASRALAPCLWLLASEYDEGAIPFNPRAIAFRLRMNEPDFLEALNPLIEAGFFVCDADASGALAACKRSACLERESEKEEEREKEEDKTTASQAPLADEEHADDRTDTPPERRSSRGTRLPPDWQPGPTERMFAQSFGLDPDTVTAEFHDFWAGVPGSRGCKLDWPATYRNRCRELGGRAARNGGGNRGGGKGVVAALRLLESQAGDAGGDGL
jgi:hypothetical protein